MLYGVEAHVCVKQTCFDLLDLGYDVTLVVDAISSMNWHDRNVGIESMKMAGAQITTFQSLVFEIMRDFRNPQFRSVMQVVKDMPKDEQGQINHIDLFKFDPRL